MKLLLTLFVLFSVSNSFAIYDLKKELQAKASKGQKALSYTEARVQMFNRIYLQKDQGGYYITDVYCGEKFYHYRGDQTPGTRLPTGLNTEHTWPQSKFSNSFPKTTQKSDLHHLYPTLNKINSERGNLPFAEVYHGTELSCDDSQVGADVQNRTGTYFEPPDEHKGNVARAMFYFSVRYGLTIDPVQEYFFRQWHILDPVTAIEKERHEIIYNVQNNRNPFIDEPELVNQVLDF